MKKMLGILLALMLLFATASPAMAWSSCTIQKDWGTSYARLRIVCQNPETPVNIDESTQSDDDSATTTIRTRIWGTGNVNVSIYSFANTSN